MTPAEKQAIYLQTLADTASAVRARKAAGITRRQVSNWEREDEDFTERAAEALETAQGAIRDKVRELALAGDQQMLALSMKVIEPALQSKPVQVGVQVNGRDTEHMDDEALWGKFEKLRADRLVRAEAAARYVVDDAETRLIAPGASPAAAGAIFVDQTTSENPSAADEPREAPLRPEDLL